MVKDEMTDVTGRVLQPPSILYGGRVRGGRGWDTCVGARWVCRWGWSSSFGPPWGSAVARGVDRSGVRSPCRTRPSRHLLWGLRKTELLCPF